MTPGLFFAAVCAAVLGLVGALLGDMAVTARTLGTLEQDLTAALVSTIATAGIVGVLWCGYTN